MYSGIFYHDFFYESSDGNAFTPSVQLLKQYLTAGASVLDYGCGYGFFLKALGAAGFIPFGVEFHKKTADVAAQRAGCEAISVDDFQSLPVKPMFDAIFITDVLEHLPAPAETLKDLLVHLKPGGILYVEGPLEINPSPVYWASWLFGTIKRLVRPALIAQHPPFHLFRTGERQQLAFFSRVELGLEIKHWQVYETGWPYVKAGVIKGAIAAIAMRLGRKKLFGMTFGNRFRGVFVRPGGTFDNARPTSVQ
jgi:SAM-dependent methyltransferase